jgi:hypothetical protein
MHHAADKGRLNNGQYGRHGRSLLEPLLIEEMQLEISRASHKSLVKVDHDATSCYDRILVAIASITSRKYGLHKNVAFVMARTLQEVKYRLKTELGISEDFYQHTKLTPSTSTARAKVAKILPRYGTSSAASCLTATKAKHTARPLSRQTRRNQSSCTRSDLLTTRPAKLMSFLKMFNLHRRSSLNA